MAHFDFSLLLFEALQKLPSLTENMKRSFVATNIESILAPLIDALQQYPRASGSADALHLIGVVHMATFDHHRSEMSCLLVHRFRKTLIDKSHHFDSIVNLTRACINLKSFDEAYQYGLLGERIDNDDIDLFSNMVVASYLSDRKDEARERFEMLKEKSPTRATQVYALVNWKSDLKDTRGDSCDHLVEKFVETKISGDFEKSKTYLSNLQKKPDGKNAWKCWRILSEIYVEMIQKNRESEYLYLQSTAGLASASGKAIAFHPDNARDDKQLLKWHRDALRELDFDDIQL